MIRPDLTHFPASQVLWGIVAVAAVAVLLWWIVGWLLGRMAGAAARGGGGFLSNRRRMLGGAALRTRAERRFEAMDESALAEWLERHPRDTLALEYHCDRLAEAARWPDYARELEYLLTLDHGMTLEETCSRHHQLADVYLRLGRPARAREVLSALAERFPGHYQAALARRRLRALPTGTEENT